MMTMGKYFDIQRALRALKQKRKRAGLSIGDVAGRSGLDPAAVSRLVGVKQDNATIATLLRYAAAIGKRLRDQPFRLGLRSRFRAQTIPRRKIWRTTGSAAICLLS